MKTQALTLITINLLIMIFSADSAGKKIEIIGVTNQFSVMPDSSLAYGDTVSIVIDGADTIFYLNDVVPEFSEEMRVLGENDIFINLTNTTFDVNERIFGISLEGFFLHYTNTETEKAAYTAEGLKNPYELMVEFAPKSIRFPSGASSKFMHLLGSYNNPVTGNPKNGLYNGGYGYEIMEIINFYDNTDEDIGDVPSFLILYNDLTDADEKLSDANNNWLDENDIADFETFFEKWLNQPTYTKIIVDGAEQYEEEPLYINNFIELVSMIEEENNYTVAVTMTINILSEPAVKVTEIIDYFRSERVVQGFLLIWLV